MVLMKEYNVLATMCIPYLAVILIWQFEECGFDCQIKVPVNAG